MYIVKMYDQEENADGFLSVDGEFGVREEAAEFSTKEEAQEALDEFLDEYNDYRDDYICKIKKIW